MSNPTISFIVPLFNHVHYSKVMLDSLINSIPPDLPYEIILIDDGSSDGTQSWIRSLNNPEIKKIFNQKNLGYAKSNNIAIRQAKGQYLALLNNDIILTEHWLQPMLDIIESPILNAGVVGNIQYRAKDQTIDHAGVELGLNGQFKHISTYSEDRSYSKCFAVTGACVLVKRDDFIETDCFDDDYINGGEDLDLCFTMKGLGKNIYISYGSKIYHHVSISRDRQNIQNEKNSRRVQGKWRSNIKSELSKKWINVLLEKDHHQINSWIDGDLAENFIASAHLAARVLAEHFLCREESRWKKLLDGVDLNDGLEKKCSAKGIRYIENHQCYLVDPEFEFHVKNLDSAINFFVCGKRVDPKLKEDLAIVINVNDIQIKLIELAQGPNINVGIINPIFLSGMDNRFKISCYFIDPSSKALLGDASKSIAVTHFVLNDMEIHRI